MAKIHRFSKEPDLSSRRSVSLHLPEFLLRALECRVAIANDGAGASEKVTLEDLVEIELAGCISLADIANLEQAVPGLGEAVSRWLDAIEG